VIVLCGTTLRMNSKVKSSSSIQGLYNPYKVRNC
jgi:hypothetical protein